MSIITIFSGSFCLEDSVVQDLINNTKYQLLTDNDLIPKVVSLSGMKKNKIENTLSAKTSIFNKFTHEKERAIAYFKLSLAEMLSRNNLLILGFAGQLIPSEATHVLKVCLIAEMKFRIINASKKLGISEKAAVKLIRKNDEDCTAWIQTLFENDDPWDPSLYDIVIPMDKIDASSAACLIKENMAKDVVRITENSKQSVEDFLLAAKVETLIANEGHNVKVKAENGKVTIIINKHILMLNRLEEELKGIVDKMPGVKSVETKVGKNYHKADIYRKYDFKIPSKVLLVDDEREFVQTLSERLLMRDMGSAVAYDGESALNMIHKDEPEVMILDLKMPGIDGIEVLRRVKETNPEIEVIILTGHGSDADKKLCMQLGAFAYLQKPVDINVLSDMLQKANDKIHKKSLSN